MTPKPDFVRTTTLPMRVAYCVLRKDLSPSFLFYQNIHKRRVQPEFDARLRDPLHRRDFERVGMKRRDVSVT